MLDRAQIREIIEECRRIGVNGLKNGVKAIIPFIKIDILNPPCDFTGATGNPAIFINRSTYKLLGSLHDNWVINQTIAVKGNILRKPTINIIGAIIHETGHAFNVAAKIENTEANAYIFEIEVMLKLLGTRSLALFDCDRDDVRGYFKSRLTDYRIGIRYSDYLAKLVEEIIDEFGLEEVVKKEFELDKKPSPSSIASEETQEDPSLVLVARKSSFFAVSVGNTRWEKKIQYSKNIKNLCWIIAIKKLLF